RRVRRPEVHRLPLRPPLPGAGPVDRRHGDRRAGRRDAERRLRAEEGPRQEGRGGEARRRPQCELPGQAGSRQVVRPRRRDGGGRQQDKKDDKKPENKLPVPAVPPTAANVAYGPLERQVLDFWQAKSDKPTPLVFCIHGGGWSGGDKSSYYGAVKNFLDNGIS